MSWALWPGARVHTATVPLPVSKSVGGRARSAMARRLASRSRLRPWALRCGIPSGLRAPGLPLTRSLGGRSLAGCDETEAGVVLVGGQDLGVALGPGAG